MAKNKKSGVTLTEDEYKVFQKMTNGSGVATVIRVGDSVPTEEDKLKKLEESNKDLIRKVAIGVKEKACLQAEIDKLKLINERDDDGLLNLMESMERDINRLKKENSEYSDIGPELTGLRSSVRKLENDNRILEKKLKDEVETRDLQIDELTLKNKELQTELDVRIEEDSRYNNLDL
jgi:chromosome segregation ATPase